MIRILIIDDKNSVLQKMEELIEPENELKVVGTANNPDWGIELVEQLQPNVAIIDLNMPSKNGIETAYLITQNYPKTKVLILTGSDDPMLNKAILAGAKGYLLKSSSKEDLIAAIYAVNRNSVYIGEGILDRVRLNSVDKQQLKLKQINLWLAQQVLNWWCEYSLSYIPTAKQILKSLALDREGLSKIKNYLCRLGSADFTLTEEIRIKVENLFAEIEDYDNLEQKLIEKKLQISNWLSHKDNTVFVARLRNNSQFLQTITLEKLQKIIAPLWQQAATIPLLNCLQGIENYLSKLQHFFEQECANSLDKENAAWYSFDYLLSSKNSHSNKQELYKKAVTFIYQCKMNVEVNNLLAQIISQTIQQLKIHLNILAQTNNLLSELKQELEPQSISKVSALKPFFEQLKSKISLSELRRDFERLTGHSLNQWGVSQSISNLEISYRLSEKLKPITQEIYSDLRKEALAISFLDYTEYSSDESTTEDRQSVDY